jgi:hypothetical protein
VSKKNLYPVCRPGYKEFTDDDIYTVNEAQGYDYYSIWVNRPDGSLNERYGQFLLKGGNSSGHSQFITLYPATTDFSIVNEGDVLKAQQLSYGHVFCIGMKKNMVANGSRVFGFSTFQSVGLLGGLMPLGPVGDSTKDPGTLDFAWFTFMIRLDGKLICLGSNNWVS